MKVEEVPQVPATIPQAEDSEQPIQIYTPPLKIRAFVCVLFREDVMGNKTKASEITGVPRAKFYYFFKNPKFRKWYSDQCNEFLTRGEAVAGTALLKEVAKGNVQAIKAYYELIGKIRTGVSVQNTIINKVGASSGRFDGEDKELVERVRRELFPNLL